MNDAPANDAQANDAPANDALANDAQANDAPANDAQANDAPANDALANDMAGWLRVALATMPAPDLAAGDAVRARAADILRPAGALQRLDELAAWMAEWQGTAQPAVRRPAALIFAADHGVAAAGVSKYPIEVTGAMLAAFRSNQSTVTAFAAAAGATVQAVDVGVGRPTGDIRVEPALSPERFDECVAAGRDAVAALDADLLVIGEMGIGNTTAAAAVAAALGEGAPADWVGRGTGVDDDGLARKRAAVEAAVARIAGQADPLEVLREVGGAELVAMAAAVMAARLRNLPVLLDGYVVTAAVLPLEVALPGALAHCQVGHCSAEPGHRRLVQRLGMQPLLDLGMRLGEGSGAMAAVPLVRMACAGITDVPTFAEFFA
ncbi:MAG: nicotinate-nucleotide--dimethylbenzimidazole phosphoribosyltransferase [Actinomycetota bacterium]|nr:nicotinate-nucleotide--dimethylbenzimidazole phosphoribosyltransferase [Actinomycetota bacterium]